MIKEIDERVRTLVDTLNALPGIDTFSSCGGHRNPNPGQQRYPRFSVDFWLKFNRRSEKAFSELVNAVSWNMVIYDVKILVGDVGGEGTPCLCFVLTGRGDPDKLARHIGQELNVGPYRSKKE